MNTKELFKKISYHSNGSISKEYFVDSEGRKQGKYFKFRDNGDKVLEFNFLNNVKHGMQYFKDSESYHLFGEYIHMENHPNFDFENMTIEDERRLFQYYKDVKIQKKNYDNVLKLLKGEIDEY